MTGIPLIDPTVHSGAAIGGERWVDHPRLDDLGESIKRNRGELRGEVQERERDGRGTPACNPPMPLSAVRVALGVGARASRVHGEGPPRVRYLPVRRSRLCRLGNPCRCRQQGTGGSRSWQAVAGCGARRTHGDNGGEEDTGRKIPRSVPTHCRRANSRAPLSVVRSASQTYLTLSAKTATFFLKYAEKQEVPLCPRSSRSYLKK